MSRAPKPRWIVRVSELYLADEPIAEYGPWVSSAGAETFAGLVRRAFLNDDTRRAFKVEVGRLGNATSAKAVLSDFGIEK